MNIKKVNELILLKDYNGALIVLDKLIESNKGFSLYFSKKEEVFKLLSKSKNIDSSSFKEPDICGIYNNFPKSNNNRFREEGLRVNGEYKRDLDSKPLVTIFTVVYNNEKTLERCIKSVLNQSYDNIEYIVIDGGSDKPVQDIVSKYIDHIDYYLSESDNGIYEAMNKAISLARGRYICLLNSDDFYEVSFVKESLEKAIESKCDVVYSQFKSNGKVVKSKGMNDGIFFSHLNLAHGTFLVHKDAYNLVGNYSTEYKIISDYKWMIEAYKKNINFYYLPKPLLNFSDGGVSSGSTENQRQTIFNEISRLYMDLFPFLSKEESLELYKIRFSNKKLEFIYELMLKNKKYDLFIKSLKSYMTYCFSERDCFKLEYFETDYFFPLYLKVAGFLDIPRSAIRIGTSEGCFSNIIKSIDIKLSLRKKENNKIILHYVQCFSRSSETFIYDLISRLESKTKTDNYILSDERVLEEQRPYQKNINIAWSSFRKEVREEIYNYIFNTLNPDVVICHFAINTWYLDQRLMLLGMNFPIITMTHGIDVYALKYKEDYSNYFINDYIHRNNTALTTVSDFLGSKLVDAGVPKKYITRVNNTVKPVFFESRKVKKIKQVNDINILAVGRLIPLKGHRFLIQALYKAQKKLSINLNLTIVYGNGEDCYEDIVNQIDELGLNKSVKLIPYVNFEENPDYYSKFDIFVHPSTYSNDSSNRTESFGLSVLEAILSGLPVITTNVGGLPEVIGEPNKFARIVPPEDSNAIVQELVDIIQKGIYLENNINYAQARMRKYSERKQVSDLMFLVYKLSNSVVKASLFATSTTGGAGYAALRLHRGLINSKMTQPTLYTTTRNHEHEEGVVRVQHPLNEGKLWRVLQNPHYQKPNLTIFTVNHPILLNENLHQLISKTGTDIINLHWSARFLSTENISFLSNLDKPLVITIRDMLPITGGCHYFHNCNRWKESCLDCPQLVNDWNNFPSKVLKAKHKYYNFNNITIVTLSKHTKQLVQQSPYFSDCRIEVIPNSIETDIFKPTEKNRARNLLNIPNKRKVIGYVPSFSSPVKGYKEAIDALSIIERKYKHLDPLILLVGNSTPATKLITLDTHELGYIDNNEKLALAYSACDLVIVPSLEETFSNTTAEAISCGTPVVGFKTGAIPEMVKDGLTGYTYEVGDIQGLAEGIVKVLSGKNMSQNCRQYAEKSLSFDLQANAYEKLFIDLASFENKERLGDIESPNCFPETTPTVLRLLEDISLKK